jgi:hypothetical protein
MLMKATAPSDLLRTPSCLGNSKYIWDSENALNPGLWVGVLCGGGVHVFLHGCFVSATVRQKGASGRASDGPIWSGRACTAEGAKPTILHAKKRHTLALYLALLPLSGLASSWLCTQHTGDHRLHAMPLAPAFAICVVGSPVAEL